METEKRYLMSAIIPAWRRRRRMQKLVEPVARVEPRIRFDARVFFASMWFFPLFAGRFLPLLLFDSGVHQSPRGAVVGSERERAFRLIEQVIEIRID